MPYRLFVTDNLDNVVEVYSDQGQRCLTYRLFVTDYLDNVVQGYSDQGQR